MTKTEDGLKFAFLIFMLIAVPVLAVGLFTALFLHRLKVDVEQEKAFRAQLSGIDLEKTHISLS